MAEPPQVVKDSKTVYALVLAAGRASRFGSTKQIAEFDGVPMVRHALASAHEACGEYVVLVTGFDAQAVAAACAPLRAAVVHNENHAQGLGSSIACGVASVQDSAAAVIVMLADQPFVTPDHVRSLIDTWNEGNYDIVATTFGNTQGPPVLFGRACFDDLRTLTGDSGAKKLLADERFTRRNIRFEPAGVDIDKPEDAKRLEP